MVVRLESTLDAGESLKSESCIVECVLRIWSEHSVWRVTGIVVT